MNEREELVKKLKNLLSVQVLSESEIERQKKIQWYLRWIPRLKMIKPPIEPNKDDFGILYDWYQKSTKDYQDALEDYEKIQMILSMEDLFREEDNRCSLVLSHLKELEDRLGNICPAKYSERIGEIIEIIEDQRADSVKEAINVMIADDYAEERNQILRDQAEEHNQILRDQAEEAQRLERERNRIIQKQQEDREANRRWCSSCRKRDYCSHFGERVSGCYE